MAKQAALSKSTSALLDRVKQNGGSLRLSLSSREMNGGQVHALQNRGLASYKLDGGNHVIVSHIAHATGEAPRAAQAPNPHGGGGSPGDQPRNAKGEWTKG